MSDEAAVSAVMATLAKRRWDKATAAQRAETGRRMLAGRRKAARARRRAAKARA